MTHDDDSLFRVSINTERRLLVYYRKRSFELFCFFLTREGDGFDSVASLTRFSRLGHNNERERVCYSYKKQGEYWLLIGQPKRFLIGQPITSRAAI